MTNVLWGIITIILCSLGYYLSFQYHKKQNYLIAVGLLILCGFALRMYTSCDFFLHHWDERYHALVAKNLIHHPLTPTLYEQPILAYEYQNWTGNHIWVHKQPLPLWTIAASLWMFGINEIALRLPSIVLTSLGIGLTYSMGCYFFNKKVGYLAAFFYSINGLIIELSAGRVATDHVDIFFLFFIQLSIYFCILFVKKQRTIFTVLAGISLGAAILSKWLPALIVLPIFFLILLDTKKYSYPQIFFQIILLASIATLVFLPWQIYIFQTFPLEAQWEASFNFKHITEALEEQTGPFYYFLERVRINYGELVYLPLIWFVWTSFRNFKDKKRLAILTWFLIPFIFFSCVTTKMQAYILFTSPAIFFMCAEFWYFLYEYRKNHAFKWAFSIVLLLLIALPIRYTFERVKPFHSLNRNPQWVKDLKALNEKNIPNAVLLNYERPIEAMFYTNLTAYSDLPTLDMIQDLQHKGYYVIIHDNGELSQEIKDMSGVHFINLPIDTE